MITKKTYGVSPTLDIVVGNTEFDPTSVNRVELHLAENQHDMLIMELSGIPPLAITAMYEKPVDVSIYTGGNFYQRFVGYVEDVRPESFTGFGLVNNSPFQTVKVVCMGASYAMRGSRSNSWSGYRLSDIATDMSTRYGFSVDTPSDRTVHESLLQTNESDWQFLTRYASFLGYSVNVHGTHLHIYDPYSAKSRQNSYHVLSTLRGTKGNVTPAPGQIIEFKGTFSKRHIDGNYKEHSTTIVNSDNTVYDVSSTTVDDYHNGYARFPNRLPEYVDSYEEASKRISAVSKQDYDYYATVRVIGLAGCVPGGIIRIDNYNGDFDRFWYVQSVSHHVHSDSFYTELELALNLNSELKFNNTRRFTTPPLAVYSKGRWVAKDRTINEYS
jgi:phage protein D